MNPFHGSKHMILWLGLGGVWDVACASQNPHWKAFVAHARATSRCVRIADDSGEEIFGKSGRKNEGRWILESWPSKFLFAGGAKASSFATAAVSVSGQQSQATSAVELVPTKRRSSTANGASTEKKTDNSASAQPGVDDSKYPSADPPNRGETKVENMAKDGATGSHSDKREREIKRIEGQSRRGQKRPAEQSQSSVSSAGNRTAQLTEQPSSQSHACTPLRPVAGIMEESAERASVEKGVRPKAAKSLDSEVAKTVAGLEQLNRISSIEGGAGGDHGKSTKASNSSQHPKADSCLEQIVLPKVAARHPLPPNEGTSSVNANAPRVAKAKEEKDKNTHELTNAADQVAARVPIKIPRKKDGRLQSSMADSAGKTETSAGLRSTSEAQQTTGDNGCSDKGNFSVQKDSYGKSCKEKHSSKNGD